MCIPAPSTFHFRQGRAMVSKEAYPGYDEFFADVAAAWRKAIRAFYDAGCRYLQLDDTAWAMICDPNEREQSKARGDDPDSLPAIYARMTNEALKDKPADMAITMHSCRGNFRSTWIAQGGYEFVAEQLLGNTNFDGYFLEYDSDRAGGFEPLRHFPKGNKQLVLGLVTSKSGRLEPKDDIKRRIEEATKYISLDQLCLSPQCGFASTEEGNVLAEEEQWAKLRMIVELAEEVWGKVSYRSFPAKRGPSNPVFPNARPAFTGSPAFAGTSGTVTKCQRHDTPLPRRPRRQSAAQRAAEGSAGKARTRRDRRCRAQGCRRPRDRKDHQAPGRHWAQSRHRRRIPPRLLELRFPWRA